MKRECLTGLRLAALLVKVKIEAFRQIITALLISSSAKAPTEITDTSLRVFEQAVLLVLYRVRTSSIEAFYNLKVCLSRLGMGEVVVYVFCSWVQIPDDRDGLSLKSISRRGIPLLFSSFL
jgi:hypothetical protein